MGNSNKFQREIDMLVEYIKKNMKHKNDWVVVKYRDVPKITGISSYYVRKIFELLKDHPNIVFEVDRDAKTYRKPLKFRYTNEEEKIKSVVTEKSFYYLNQDEIDYVKDKLDINSYEKLFKMINMINFIASTGAKEKFVPLKIEEIADILVESKKVIQENVERLIKNDILIDKNGYFRLVLDANSLQELQNEIKKDSAKVHPLYKDREEFIQRLLEKQGIELNTSHHESDASDDLLNSKSLLENMNDFLKAVSEIHLDFQGYLKSEIERIIESNKKEEELNEGYETLQKLMEENNRLTEENEELKKENRLLLASLEKNQAFRDKFIINAEQRLEILLAEIIGIVNNYSKLPGWQKDEVANAKLQKSILDSVTSAVDDMLNIEVND